MQIMNKGVFLRAGLALFFALCISAASASAEEKIQCEVLAIRADNADGGKIAKELSAYAATLKKPPFNSFSNYELLGKKAYELGPEKKKTELKLPSQLGGSLTYKGFMENQFHFDLKILKKEGSALSTTIKAAPGRPFFIAGFSLPNGGTLVVGFICKK